MLCVAYSLYCSDEDHGYNGVCSALVKTIATHLALMFALVMLSIHVSESDLHANAKAKAFVVMVMVIVTAVTNTKTRIEKNVDNDTKDPRVECS